MTDLAFLCVSPQTGPGTDRRFAVQLLQQLFRALADVLRHDNLDDDELVAAVAEFLYRITEPALAPIRRFMPNLGGLDISPIILILLIMFIQRVILYYIYPNVI